tara:strand:- start:798 stop:1010 length:213 start_codon:yes stop_codon:yes gene_type:complete
MGRFSELDIEIRITLEDEARLMGLNEDDTRDFIDENYWTYAEEITRATIERKSRQMTHEEFSVLTDMEML